MASKPGFLTHWPWKNLGNLKYLLLAPWVVHSAYSFATTEYDKDRDYTNIFSLSLLLSRVVHAQIWFSVSRYRTAKGNNRIVDKGIEFELVDRERNWDDQILFNGIAFYGANLYFSGASHLPVWRTDGVILTILLHMGPVEFLYYWLHRALHHHYLYSRYHSHHHSSIVTEPITSVIHPFAEHIAYFTLFSIPILGCVLLQISSMAAIAGYITYVDFMNYMGHCNFELIPDRLFSAFPPLKYLMYTPTFHSLHHTQFRTNYCLFVPFYDYVYGTMDKSTDALHEASLKKEGESPQVVHLSHLTTPESIYHLRLVFASLASKPYKSMWYLCLIWPVTFWSMILTCLFGRTFIVESNRFKGVRLQTWAIPKYKLQFCFRWQMESINRLIEKAVLDAEEKGVKVFSLGLLNQGEELNRNGELYVERYPQMKLKVVDGSSLAVAVVVKSIPTGTTKILLRGNLTKVAYHIATFLCSMGVQVATSRDHDYEKLKTWLGTNSTRHLVLSRSSDFKVWLVGDGLREDEQLLAPKGTTFIPFAQLPPKKSRKDCFYHFTPAMLAPQSVENVDSCENWLPRRVMSVWRIAGMVHALEGWDEHECGQAILDVEKVWEATLRHGFRPLINHYNYA